MLLWKKLKLHVKYTIAPHFEFYSIFKWYVFMKTKSLLKILFPVLVLYGLDILRYSLYECVLVNWYLHGATLRSRYRVCLQCEEFGVWLPTYCLPSLFNGYWSLTGNLTNVKNGTGHSTSLYTVGLAWGMSIRTHWLRQQMRRHIGFILDSIGRL